MKQYLLAMHQPVGPRPPAEFLDQVMAELNAVHDELAATGQWVFGNGLHDPDASTVVRVRDGEVLTTDGPYAEGKEHLGGITIIKAPDLDAALKIARRYAEITGLPIEVRPFIGAAG